MSVGLAVAGNVVRITSPGTGTGRVLGSSLILVSVAVMSREFFSLLSPMQRIDFAQGPSEW